MVYINLFVSLLNKLCSIALNELEFSLHTYYASDEVISNLKEHSILKSLLLYGQLGGYVVNAQVFSSLLKSNDFISNHIMKSIIMDY